jgi:hypothetical protein
MMWDDLRVGDMFYTSKSSCYVVDGIEHPDEHGHYKVWVHSVNSGWQTWFTGWINCPMNYEIINRQQLPASFKELF